MASSRARAIAAVKEVKVLETNQQGIGGGNTVTPNIIIVKRIFVARPLHSQQFSRIIVQERE